MRYLLITLSLLLLGCPKQEAAKPSTASGPRRTVVLLCSQAGADAWTGSIISAAGDRLAIDPWATPGESGHIDVYGPYDATLGKHNVSFVIGLSSLERHADLESLTMLGDSAKAWIEGLDPDAVWLEGDPAQYYVGAKLDPALPVIFSGVESELDIYYGADRAVSGVYKRHSIARVVGELWKLAPDAKTFALLSDDSPIDMQRMLTFDRYETALPEGNSMLELSAVKSWDDFGASLRDAETRADALIVCGAGGEGASAELLDTPAPHDLFAGLKIPAVVLGPSRVDHCGVLSLQLQPAAHAALALDMLEQVLSGSSPQSLGPVTPDKMAAFMSESGDTAD